MHARRGMRGKRQNVQLVSGVVIGRFAVCSVNLPNITLKARSFSQRSLRLVASFARISAFPLIGRRFASATQKTDS